MVLIHRHRIAKVYLSYPSVESVEFFLPVEFYMDTRNLPFWYLHFHHFLLFSQVHHLNYLSSLPISCLLTAFFPLQTQRLTIPRDILLHPGFQLQNLTVPIVAPKHGLEKLSFIVRPLYKLMHMNGSRIGLVLSATAGPWRRASTKLNQPHYEAVSRGSFPFHQHLHKDVPLLVRSLYIPNIVVKRWIDHDKQPLVSSGHMWDN